MNITLILLIIGLTSAAHSAGGAQCVEGQSDVPANRPEGRNPKSFIQWLKPFALRVQSQTKLPASILIAVAAEESGFGTSRLARKANNFFGIRCGDKGLKFDGKEVSPKGCSRGGGGYAIFSSVEDGLRAGAAKLMLQSPRSHPSFMKRFREEAKKGGSSAVEYIGEWMTGDNKPSNANYKKYVATIKTHIREQDLAALDKELPCEPGGRQDVADSSADEPSMR